MSDSPATAIEFANVTYRVNGDRTLISGLNLSIRRGETLMLLGRSGSGKTTTLKLINRLLAQSAGTVLVDGRSTAEWDVIELRRHIGYAIQEAGLFPHYTVKDNVALVPQLERWDAPQRMPTEVLSRPALRPGDLRQLIWRADLLQEPENTARPGARHVVKPRWRREGSRHS